MNKSSASHLTLTLLTSLMLLAVLFSALSQPQMAQADDNTPTATPTPLCANDSFEPDNTFSQAKSITTDGTRQSHINTNPSSEEDWVKFYATSGHPYEIRTQLINDINQSDTAANDTLLYLYGPDGITQLTSNDDVDPGSITWYMGDYHYRESLINWTAPADGVYYVMETQWGPTVPWPIRDCHGYWLWIQDMSPKNFGHLPSAYLNMNLLADGGAWSVTGDTYLGATVTTAADGINNSTYTPKASDDGVTWTGSWVSGTGHATVNVTCPAGTCFLYAWADWNNDKDFNDTNEAIYAGTVLNGSNNINFAYAASGNLAAGTYYTRFRVYAQLPSSPQPAGEALRAGGYPIVGEIEDPFITSNGDGGTPTPVTLSYFLSQRQGSNVNFSWSTATETGNVGFNLYVQDNGNRTQINTDLIPSQVIDSLDRQDYTFSAKVNGTIFYIEDVSVLGETRLHGPFQLGQKYGDRLEADKVDWAAVQSEHDNKFIQQQNGLKKEINIPASALIPLTSKPDVTVNPGNSNPPAPTAVPTSTTVPKNQINRPKPTRTPGPTYPPKPTGTPTPTSTTPPNPTGTPTPTTEPTAPPVTFATPMPVDPASLQLTTTYNFKVRQTGIYRVTYEMLQAANLDLAGVPVTKITVINRNLMVPVYVYTPDPAGNFGPGGLIEFYGEALDTIYTDTNIYTVQVSNAPVPQISDTSGRPDLYLVPSSSYPYTLVVNNQLAYSNSAPGADPWYAKEMLAYTTSKSWSFTFQVNGLADPSASGSLELVVWGVTDWPQSPDHHLKVSVNGVAVANQSFDGLVEETLEISLPAGALHEGANTLQLTLPGDTGVAWDVIDLDKFSITYQRIFQATDGRLTFTASGDAFQVTNLPSANVVVYRMRNGGLARLNQVQVQASGSTFTASFSGTEQTDTYLVTTAEALYAPVLEATRLQADLSRPAQYLIISNPDFISGLGPLVAARRAQGLTVSVVDVTDLYTKYTYGIFDPQAIKQYIAYAAQNLGTQYVLLVGGDTYDYRNFLGRNSISFIPSLYVSTGPVARFVPADPLYADLNGDNVPDLAIGRFPVRSTAELDLMVSKTLEYAGKNYGYSAVFASDVNDGIVSFKDISNSLASSLPSGWSVQNIHMDDVGVTAARTQLLAAMNQGIALVTFTGHSEPVAWSFDNLFTNADAAALTNTGRPFVVVQWGCWNTYVVDPVNNYLVQKFLFSGDQGAAAVMGASTLTDSTSENMLGELLTPRLVMPGMPIGQALQDAKSELARTHPELLDVLLGWSLMGDPAMVIEP